ncbi:hypothetical protein ACWEQ4_16200 [Rhodococcus sp. NPDC003994]
MAQNRKARRAARYPNRGRTSRDVNDEAIYMPRNHADDRVLVGLSLLPQSMPLIESEFETLHKIMGLIEQMLLAASTDNPDHWFPNNMAAHACLIRSYQGLQASACLCVQGFYAEALATTRVVYESAGLARALAHKTADAEKWLHEGHWKNDGFSRKFGREMSAASTDAGIAYQQFYEHASQYAHPMATSVLPMLFGNNGDRYGPRLYPEFDGHQFSKVARQITIEALFVAYALRNAAAEVEVLPPEWLKELAVLAELVTGEQVSDVQRDWVEFERRHRMLLGKVRHDDELDGALDADSASVRNRKKRYIVQPAEKDSEGGDVSV